MRILAIETSCDETAVSFIEGNGASPNISFHVRGNALYSQARKHAAYGGVYPSLAKREHAANLVPLLDQALAAAGAKVQQPWTMEEEQCVALTQLLTREERLADILIAYLTSIAPPKLDALAVTQGPGLEPALWVGINFARALSMIWGIPIIPVNHLEGHIVASAVDAHKDGYQLAELAFPVLGLILSGGHTEFVHASTWGSYNVIGHTRDDSIGEAFDKVARLLGIAYPGGPGLSHLAATGRRALETHMVPAGGTMRPLPRPMIHSGDLDFSFSGLKTAVLYQVRALEKLTDEQRAYIAADFENAVTEVVLKKTARALAQHPASTFVLGGGVSANTRLRSQLTRLFKESFPTVTLRMPSPDLSTDNAVMIGMAGYLMHLRNAPTCMGTDELRADGTLSL